LAAHGRRARPVAVPRQPLRRRLAGLGGERLGGQGADAGLGAGAGVQADRPLRRDPCESGHGRTRPGGHQGAVRQLREPALRRLCPGDVRWDGWPGRCGDRAGDGARGRRERAMTLTLLKAWQGAKERLEAAGLAGPVIDARLLVEAAADATRADIVGDPYRELTP